MSSASGSAFNFAQGRLRSRALPDFLSRVIDTLNSADFSQKNATLLLCIRESRISRPSSSAFNCAVIPLFTNLIRGAKEHTLNKYERSVGGFHFRCRALSRDPGAAASDSGRRSAAPVRRTPDEHQPRLRARTKSNFVARLQLRNVSHRTRIRAVNQPRKICSLWSHYEEK
jgi:hypothetical protein